MTIPYRASALTHHNDFGGSKTLSSEHASSNETLVNAGKNANKTDRENVKGTHGRNFAATSPKINSVMDSMSNATSMTAQQKDRVSKHQNIHKDHDPISVGLSQDLSGLGGAPAKVFSNTDESEIAAIENDRVNHGDPRVETKKLRYAIDKI